MVQTYSEPADELYESIKKDEGDGPKPMKRRPLPTLESIRIEVTRLRMLMSERDRRIEEDRLIARLYTLMSRERGDMLTNDDADDHATYLSLPDTIINSILEPIASARHVLNIPAEEMTDEAKQAADDQEDICRHFWERAEERYVAGGGSGSLMEALTRPGVEDGYLYGRITADIDDTQCPARIQIWDTLEVLPVFRNGDRLLRCYRVYRVTVAQLREEYPKETKRLFSTDDDDMEVECTAYYDEDYHALAIADRNEWLKPPVPHDRGYIPVFCMHFKGYGSRATNIANMQRMDVEADRARGALSAVRSELLKLADALAARNKLVQWVANPSWKEKVPAMGQPAEGDLAPGQVVRVQDGGDLEMLQAVNSNIVVLDNQIKQYVEFIRENTGVWGQDQLGASALQDLQFEQRNSKLRPYFRGMRNVLQTIYRMVLDVYREWAEQVATLTPGGDGYDYNRYVDPALVIPEKPMVLVRFDDKSPAEKTQFIIASMQAVQANALSRQTVLEQSGIEDVSEEMERIRSEMAWADPSSLQALGPVHNYYVLKSKLDDAIQKQDWIAAGIIQNSINVLIAATRPQQPQQPPGMGGALPPQAMQALAGGLGQPGPSPLMGPPMLPPGMPPMPMQGPMPGMGGPMMDGFTPPPGVPSSVLPQGGFAPGMQQLNPMQGQQLPMPM